MTWRGRPLREPRRRQHDRAGHEGRRGDGEPEPGPGRERRRGTDAAREPRASPRRRRRSRRSTSARRSTCRHRPTTWWRAARPPWSSGTAPCPAGGKDTIHPPRARADMGPFVGAISGYTLGTALGGYDSWANTRLRSEFEIGARLGFGLEGLLTRSMDGQMWLQGELVAGPVQLDLGCSTCPTASGKRTDTAVPRVGSPHRPQALLADAVLRPALRPHPPRPDPDVHLPGVAHGRGLRCGRREGSCPSSARWRPASAPSSSWPGGRSGSRCGATRGTRTSSSTPPRRAPRHVRLVNYDSLELGLPGLRVRPAPRLRDHALARRRVPAGIQRRVPDERRTSTTAARPFGLGPSWNIYLRFRLDARKYFGGSAD